LIFSSSSFASLPGKERVNCAVTMALPRIEEGSTSSSLSFGSERDSCTPSATHKNATHTKTKPDVLAVGKFHKKSKGKVSKIIVVSGKELDKKARAEKKKISAKTGNRADKKVSEPQQLRSDPEQPLATTADQGCACVIM